MSEEFKEFWKTPALTLEPFKEKSPVSETKETDPVWDDTILSEEEKRMVDQFTSQIDLHNSNIVLQYGAGTQKKMADFSERALANVQTKAQGMLFGKNFALDDLIGLLFFILQHRGVPFLLLTPAHVNGSLNILCIMDFTLSTSNEKSQKTLCVLHKKKASPAGSRECLLFNSMQANRRSRLRRIPG